MRVTVEFEAERAAGSLRPIDLAMALADLFDNYLGMGAVGDGYWLVADDLRVMEVGGCYPGGAEDDEEER